MKKTIIKTLILVVIIMIAIFFGLYTFLHYPVEKTYVTSTRKCPYFENYRKTEVESEYKNTTVGFSIKIPKGWYIPGADDSDPRMYNCDNIEGGPSLGIYSTHYSSSAGAYDNYMKDIPVEKVYKDIIPGAIVIKEKIENLETAPWGYLFIIVFEKEKKVLHLIVPGNIEDSPILPTLKLI